MEGKIIIRLKFIGFDDWHRPVFKWEEKNYYFGSVEDLGDYPSYSKDNTIEGQNAVEFFKKNPERLVYFGREFNCEPYGNFDNKWKFKFVEDEK